MSYQGRFSQPRGSEDAVRETPMKKAAPVQEQPRQVPQKDTAPKTPSAPAKKPAKKTKKKKKANRNITLIFYTLYFLFIIAVCGGLYYANGVLTEWLVSYEASQPTTKADAVFAEYFADPDWTALYEKSGQTDTLFEGSEAFASYMSAKVGTGELTYAETSAGLTGGHKYLLKLGTETIGYFTLQDQSGAGDDMPDWQLGEVSLNTSFNKSVLIQKTDGHTVYVNGIALDDSYTIQIATTLAENYLPDGIKGPRLCVQQVEGLMAEPTITAADEDGNPTTVTYDAESGMYIEQTEANTISLSEEELVLTAAETYAKYMIEESNYAALAKYFDSSSQIYKTIIGIDPWMQGNNGYAFANESVSEYCRYSDKYFSARVVLSLNVTRRDGTVKEYPLNTTLFFKHNGSKWLVFEMTNVEVQTPIAEVRLTFKNGDAVLSTNLYEDDITSLVAPVVTAPEGKVFAGWYRQDTDENGSQTYTLVFSPDANGNITLPAGTKLEPMTLYALFEDSETEVTE